MIDGTDVLESGYLVRRGSQASTTQTREDINP